MRWVKLRTAKAYNPGVAGLPLRVVTLKVGMVAAAVAVLAGLGARTPPTVLAPAQGDAPAPLAGTGDLNDGEGRGMTANTIMLFDGTSTTEWQTEDGTAPIRWPIVDGALEVCAGCGDIQTVRRFGDFRLHLEFWAPEVHGASTEKERGNIGIHLQGHYEVQVLDSFGIAPGGQDDAGAVYGVKDPDTNASLPAESWQAYDITFRAARWSGETKTAPARVTVVLNGRVIHADVEIPSSTPGGDRESPQPGPIRLQDHGDPVRYRNIWIEPLD